MATWADIQRLAADLQRVQLSKGIERLSDSNCVEIISKLIQSNAIDVIFTVDGKEYITRRHLLTQIAFECDGSGGRIPIVDIASNLRIDLHAAKEGIEQLLTESDRYLVSQDELIAFDYIDDLCKQLDEMLFEEGHLSVYSLTQKWNVPIEFLKQYILTELGTKICGQRDGDTLYTNEFVEAQCYKLLAAFCATTRGTQLNVYYNYMNVEQGLFFNLVKQLVNEEKINGSIVGPKSSLSALFVPYIQEKMTNDLVRSKLLNERVITIDTLKKLNVADHSSLLNTLFKNNEVKLINLPTVVITEDLYSDLKQNIEEDMKKHCFCNIDNIFGEYSFFENSDIQQIVKKVVKSNSSFNWMYNEGDYIFTNEVIKKTIDSLSEFIKDKAVTEAPNIIQAFKEANTPGKKLAANDDDDWNAKGGKKKGGKKGGNKKNEKEPVSTVNPDVFLVSKEEVITKLEEIDIIPVELIDEVIDDVMLSINKKFKAEVESQFTAGSSGKEQKMTLQEKMKEAKMIYTSFCCYEQGASIFTESLKEDLNQYLLKSIGQEFALLVLSMFVEIPNNHQQLTPKVRNECINSIPDKKVQEELNALFDSITSIDKFHDAALSLDNCNVLVKKPNKSDKEEFLRIFADQQTKYLEDSVDQAQLLLNIVIMIVFNKAKVPIHASGKFVSPIAKQLVDVCANAMNPIPGDIADSVLQAISLVVKVIKGSADENEKVQLDSLLSKLKDYLKN